MMFINHSTFHTYFRLYFLLFILLLISGCANITSFVPQGGQVGSEIEILGSGFSSTAADNTVRFGSKTATVLEASGERLLVSVPSDVVRSKIKVSLSWFNNVTSKSDYIPLPDYLKYKRFESTVLKITATEGLKQGYWIMYPPSFGISGKKFPVIYALHGANFSRNPLSAELGELLEDLGITNLGTGNEHSWVFGVNDPGIYFPFIARASMETTSISNITSMLQTRLFAVAGSVDQDDINNVVDSIVHYFPKASVTDLVSVDEMIIVMPDGENSWYTDRLGPPERRTDGIGTESIFPTSTSVNPANRFDNYVTGWFETHIIDELIPLIENDIGLDNLVTESDRRFIMGISMGGYGSLKLALKHQDKFVATASLSGAGQIKSSNINIRNKFLPAIIDVFGSAPLAFNASESELATIHLDEGYLTANNPMDLIQLPGPINLQFFVEIGENDLSDSFGGNTIANTQEFIAALTDLGVPVSGGIVPAAIGSEPNNGNANHVAKFWRTRFGEILKFFSDIYTE